MCFHQAVDAKTRRFLPATATPALDINRLLGILSGSADDGADTLDGLPLRIIKKMRVPARCDRIRVAQKRADQRQARAAAGKLAGERMPQIMNSQAGDTGGSHGNGRILALIQIKRWDTLCLTDANLRADL